MASFSDLGLSPSSLQAVAALGWRDPTPVQARVIPLLRQGKDVVVQAATGSGKTGAYALPLLERFDPAKGLQALVLVPTRELANQVVDVLNALGRGVGFTAFPVYGGTHVERMAEVLDRDRPACIVATPGRLMDLVDREELRLLGVRTVILDEADRMLDMGFLKEAQRVLHLTRHRELTGLFSATIPRAVAALAQEELRLPETVKIETVGQTEGAIEHFRINVKQEEKLRALVGILQQERPAHALVFIRTRDYTDRVARALRHAGFTADALHGERTQAQREHVVDLLRKGATQVVVATDVAARGIDVPEVELVVNLDVPDDWNVYIHRAGRTGRAGRSGKVFSLITPDEKKDRLGIERILGREMTPYRLTLPDFVEPPPPRPPRTGPPGSPGDPGPRPPPRKGTGKRRPVREQNED
ncbi:MAG TPA: DEAD/DEAH box helicase [Candidatus Thermoplasmatota archaeon]|nr:DEAD/DEAH box helicase [Candidatus Thermoplasmatota archaeon]